MTFDADDIRRHIPLYLTDQSKDLLLAELEAIGRGETVRYILTEYEDSFDKEMLQGDGWRGFVAFDFESSSTYQTRGMVLSNSCDVSQENTRALPVNVSFAPLVKLSAYEALLSEAGQSAQSIRAKSAAIRSQIVTSIFFLPSGGPLTEDYIVLFDAVQSMPLSAHSAGGQASKLFTLSDAGFWMLVLKLSIHFCRMHEGVSRTPRE
jgi:hypothetical protein